jgi:hypothetical protein
MTPTIDPRQIRPPRAWYGVAVFIAVGGIAVGVSIFVLGIFSVAGSLPDLRQTSKDGSAMTVQLTAKHPYAFYVPESSKERCKLAPAEGVNAQPASYSLTFTSGSRDWALGDEFTVANTGTYTATCNNTAFAIGDRPQGKKFAKGLGIGVGAFVGVPCLSIVIGSVMGLVVALRRRSARNRLQAAYSQQRPDGY